MEAAAHVAAMKPLLPAPPPGAPGPFALSDESKLRAFAEAGGLKPISTHDVVTPWHYADAATALRALASAGVAVKAIENAGQEAFNDAMNAVIVKFTRPDGTVGFCARFRYLVAAP